MEAPGAELQGRAVILRALVKRGLTVVDGLMLVRVWITADMGAPVRRDTKKIRIDESNFESVAG
jgi:hypothetical protein